MLEDLVVKAEEGLNFMAEKILLSADVTEGNFETLIILQLSW